MNPKTRIILLRHGETAAPDLFHGSESDIGLGPRGWEQARVAASQIQGLRPTAIYCSGMRRAVETAHPIADACGLELRVHTDLRERKMGPLSGFSRTEGWPIYEETKSRWMSGDLDFTHPEGESYAQIRDRVVPAIESIASNHEGESIVVVGHGVANRVIIASLVSGFTPSHFDEITIEFVKVTELVKEAGLWTIND